MMEFKIATNYGDIVLSYLGKKFLPNAKQENWKDFIQKSLNKEFEVPKEKIFSLSQVHGDKFLTSSELSKHPDLEVEADAMISDRMDELLVIRTADCVPIAIWSYDYPLIANIHSGWKGTKEKILEKTYFQMKEILATKNIHHPKFGFAIGPRIAGRHYEIDYDVAQYFKDTLGLMKKDGSKFNLDLGKLIEVKIREIAEDPVILDFTESTYESEIWFSHRAKDEGRNLNCIRIKI